MKKITSLLSRAKVATVAAVSVVAAPVFAVEGDAVDQLTTAATSQMGGVSTGMIALGIILVGVAALGFTIYKIVSMSGGRKA
ncbi:hypothetical protein D9M68_486390 [compost metagenome]